MATILYWYTQPPPSGIYKNCTRGDGKYKWIVSEQIKFSVLNLNRNLNEVNQKSVFSHVLDLLRPALKRLKWYVAFSVGY